MVNVIKMLVQKVVSMFIYGLNKIVAEDWNDNFEN